MTPWYLGLPIGCLKRLSYGRIGAVKEKMNHVRTPGGRGSKGGGGRDFGDDHEGGEGTDWFSGTP